MHIKVLTRTEELESIKPEWNEILEKSTHNAVNLSHDWILAWWHNFGKRNNLYIILVYDNAHQIMGIAPLIRVKSVYRSVKVIKLSLMANGHSPFSDIIVDKENVEPVVRTLLQHFESIPDWDIVDFTKIHRDSPTCQVLLTYLEQKKKPFGLKNNIESPFIVIDSDWGTFLSHRSPKFRKALRNKLNRADHCGDLSFEKISITDGQTAVLQDMFAVSRKSWKARSGTDILSSTSSAGFYKELCDRFGPQGMVNLYLLKKAGEMIAFEFHLTYNHTTCPIRADFVESFRPISPGSILETHILRTLFEEARIHEYNTCGHTYDYLMKWTNATRQYVNVEIFNTHLRPRVLHALEYTAIPLLKRMGLDKLKKRLS